MQKFTHRGDFLVYHEQESETIVDTQALQPD